MHLLFHSVLISLLSKFWIFTSSYTSSWFGQILLFFLRFQTSRDFAGLRKSYNWLVWRNTRCIENCIWRALQVYEVYMSDFGRILHFHCILVFWTPSRHLKALSWRPGWKPSTCCLFSTGRLCSSLCKGNAHSHDASGAFKSSCACKSCKQARYYFTAHSSRPKCAEKLN